MKVLRVSTHRNHYQPASTDKFRLLQKIKKNIVILFYPGLFGAIIGSLTINLYLFIMNESIITHIVLTITIGIVLGCLAGILILRMLNGEFTLKDILGIVIFLIFSVFATVVIFILFKQKI